LITPDETAEKGTSHFGTSALLEYSWASLCDSRLFHFAISVVLKGDYTAFIAKQALAGNEYKTLTPTDLATKQPGPLIKQLRNSRQELIEMFLSRVVDNFQIYLVEIIRLALQKEPRILSERKQEITLGHILKFDSIEALTRDIIEKKLNDLAYDGFASLEKWCRDKAIPLMVPDDERGKIVELIALRNIITHARGVVDERYKAAAPSSTFKVGEKRELQTDDLFAAIQTLDSAAGATDAAVANKFGIDRSDVKAMLASRSAKRWPPPVKNDVRGGDATEQCLDEKAGPHEVQSAD
jgi:hypothetical protein